ncbi:MAG: hypothetical protein IT446_16085 [Phycisphaerales bacterium]|nr:hypothetical protein [Phycisphaerales bacterium]
MKTLQDVMRALPHLESALDHACRWLVEVAQVRTDGLTVEYNTYDFDYRNWRGAIRGEYWVAFHQWGFFCPVWHTGQAVKALLLAHQVNPSLSGCNPDLLSAATAGADFILNQQVVDGPDAGLIHAFEGVSDIVYTSAIFEALDGVYLLGHITGDQRYVDAANAAMKWCRDKTWLRGQGLVRDAYQPALSRFRDDLVITREDAPGRPLVDDAVWLTAWRATGEDSYRQAFYEILHRLLRDEHPRGNWVEYGPCRPEAGECHPRHAYWWGLPMIAAWRDCKDPRWLDAARRAGEWYIQAQRNDGGLFRFTDLNFKTGCFEMATSGILCASILWLELYKETGETLWLEPIHRAMTFAMSVQFTAPQDANLRGCVLENVRSPDGTDRSPYHVRDLATIFFIQAVAMMRQAAGDEVHRPPSDVRINQRPQSLAI